MDERLTDRGDDALAELLAAIRRDGSATRGELSANTGLARSTVAQRVDLLMEAGLVIEVGEAESTGSRPPSLLGFNQAAGVVLAADLGATHSRIAITDLEPSILVERTADIDINDGPEAVLGWLDGVFDELLAESGWDRSDVRGIGIGVPGPVDFDLGMVVDPPIMAGWNEFPIAERYRTTFGVPVLVDNDVNIMAAGEFWAVGSDVQNLVFVKVGTGIGSGLVLGGRLHRGVHGAAGDIGHVQATDEVLACRCGNTGCLEASAGGAALAATLRARGLDVADARGVVELVEMGDTHAVSAVRDAGRLIGNVLATMVNLVNPKVIVIGGDIARAERQLLAGIREIVYQRSNTLSTQDLVISASKLGDRAGVIGAASMVVDHVLEPKVLAGTLELARTAAG
jgi:predicted NBD/HSP70 family sugar kinase